MPTRALLLTLLLASPIAGRAEDLILLLQQRNCPGCHLEDVDLVHADLRNADLQRANLGQARLDGPDLRKSNLRSPTCGELIFMAARFMAPTYARPT